MAERFRAETRAAIAAVEAGLAVVLSRQDAEDVRFKGPRDMVTGTDVAAQAAIERVLRDYDAAIAFVGEEGDPATVPDARRYWLVDPLCGTSNFAAELPFFAVNVALVEDDKVTIGVVADGTTGEVHVAERGGGAFLLGGEQLKVNPKARPVSLDPILPGPARLSRFGTELAIRVLADARYGVRILATTLSLIYLARGRMAAAVYVCGGLPVHFAAGLLIAEEAGAIVTDERGEPWQLFGPIYIAAANPEVHRFLQRTAQETVAAITGD